MKNPLNFHNSTVSRIFSLQHQRTAYLGRMKLISIFLMFLLPLCVALGDECQKLTKQSIGESLASEVTYFIPSNAITAYSLNGLLFFIKSGRCCQLSESEKGLLQASPAQCTPKIREKALAPYASTPDFSKFKNQFLSCLKQRNIVCLRPLVMRRFQASFGFEGYGDLRESALNTWTAQDLQKMEALIQIGTVGAGERRQFPPNPENDGTGLRGTFLLTKNGWLLESFLSGD